MRAGSAPQCSETYRSQHDQRLVLSRVRVNLHLLHGIGLTACMPCNQNFTSRKVNATELYTATRMLWRFNACMLILQQLCQDETGWLADLQLLPVSQNVSMCMPEGSMGIHLLLKPPRTHWKCDTHRYAWKLLRNNSNTVATSDGPEHT